MEQYKKDFIEFMVESEVLTFGDFTTKSGRKTPFFINTGKYRTGAQMARLGYFYAEALKDRFGDSVDVLFGPAYKGIPLVTAVSMALYESGVDVSFCFNRKEEKDHGEGGSLVGQKLYDGARVVIIEDVTTAGTSIYETMPILKGAADVSVKGLLVSVDRMERGSSELSAFAQLRKDFAFQTEAIVTIDEVVEYLYNREVNGKVIIDDQLLEAIKAYRNLYGA